jgi:HEAT repeat protein
MPPKRVAPVESDFGQEIQIVAKTEAGDVTSLKEGLLRPLVDVKIQLAETWKIPAAMTSIWRLVDDKASNLRESELLDRYFYPEDEVELLLKFTVEPIEEEFADVENADVERLLKLLAEFGTDEDPSKARVSFESQLRASAKVMNAMASWLESPDRDRRKMVMQALQQACPVGDKRAIDALLAHLDSEIPEIRCDMLWLLSQLSTKGDDRVVLSVISRCSHPEWKTREAAATALGVLAEKGHERSISTLALRCMEDGQWGVRRAAVASLHQIAMPGNKVAISALRGRLGDRDWSTRAAAAEVLGFLAVKGDRQSMSSLIPCLEDGDADVRSAAVTSIGKIMRIEDGKAIIAVGRCLEDVHSKVREAAADALCQENFQGAPTVVSQAFSRLSHLDMAVKCAAARVLAKVSAKGDRRNIGAVDELFEDKSPDVRCSAVKAQGAILSHERALEVLAQRLSDSSAQVRAESARTLTDIAVKGSPRSVKTMCDYALDPSSQVRQISVEALSKVANQGDKLALASLMEHLEDPSSQVRKISIETLGKVAITGDEHAIASLTAHLEDVDESVRLAVTSALQVIDPQEEGSEEDV